ncbi:DUF1648 domain-containing protein [Virgibacillus sp. 179-BFC.A HS]|uniref:DUF1648 domain-containing protein n=1 Tax=Tigheibacillus jepli TaxID=3035914 RepID=A0ABU5CGU1_9BACI|nr:DUF1648 domain-containing protein [Virgibacillus sp. 179-BFC.A HS]MDY0405059.1 DUF1648 domain-containing protein [Virgibacillus sp. 179-BFC.A HS]
MGTNPKINVEVTLSERICTSVAVALIIATFISALHTYLHVPAQVPIHFDLNNKPDRWGSSLTIFLLPLVSLILFIPIYLIGKKPHLHNYPIAVTESNAKQLYQLSRLLVAVMNAEIALTFAVITLEIGVFMAGETFGMWPVVVCIALVIATPIVFIMQMRRKG